jgi:antitoxin component of MazEF toxin-antitoxin module
MFLTLVITNVITNVCEVKNMSSLKVRKVGNSLGVLFPKDIQDILKISEGDLIDMTTVGSHKIVLDSHLPHHSEWVFKKSVLSPEDQAWLDADLEDDDDKVPK